MAIATLCLLDRLRQARIGHSIEDVADALRMILLKDRQNLVVELLDTGARATFPFYRACTINCRRHRPPLNCNGEPKRSVKDLRFPSALGRVMGEAVVPTLNSLTVKPFALSEAISASISPSQK